MAKDEWRFAMMTRSEGASYLGGCDITPDEVSFLEPGSQTELVTRGLYQTLEITVSTRIAEDLGGPDVTCRHG